MIILVRLSFFATFISVAGFALFPHFKVPPFEIMRGFTDLLYHLSGFAALSFLAAAAWRASPGALIALGLVAIALEAAQMFVPGRTVSLLDAAASLSGVVVGSAVYLVLARLQRLLSDAGGMARGTPAPFHRQRVEAAPGGEDLR